MKTTNDFLQIVLNQSPLIDVRAPIEFEKGAFMNAVNLPIMDDNDRHVVGIKYKEEGNAAATELGYDLVSGEVREARTKAWLDFMDLHPDALLYCFRGGSRSRISQEWIKEAGRDIVRLEGGYKAFRTYLLDALTPEAQIAKPIILSGCTGSGKTLILKDVPTAIDLEGIAHHRGSSFGHHIDAQPSQINFDNNLAYALITHKHNGYQHVVLEDEGRNVGRRFLPIDLVAHYKTGDYVVVDVSLEERVNITLQEYVIESQASYIERFGELDGLSNWHTYIQSSMERVKKRLGGDRLKIILDLFEDGYEKQLATGAYASHEAWLESFLRDYYDPMYNYQMEKVKHNVIFRGNRDEVTAYLRSLT
jgi:tRNA 2-selenouridine synthase